MITFIIGGSGSGKSEYAENYLLSVSQNRRIYIATMQPHDEECIKRIQKHRAMRASKSFTTIECYTHLEELQYFFTETEMDSCQEHIKCDILLECMSNLMANELYTPPGRAENTVDLIISGVEHLAGQAEHLVIVSNDVFSDGNRYDPFTQAYMQKLGELHIRLAAFADEVIEVVAGCPLFYKRKE